MGKLFSKKAIIIGSSLLVVIIALVYLLYPRQYSISDITADNRDKLKESSDFIAEEDISSSTQIKLKVFHSYRIDQQTAGTERVTRIDRDDYLQVIQESSFTNLRYVSNWGGPDKNKLKSFSIQDNTGADMSSYGTKSQFKEIVNDLLHTEGFTLKESLYKGGGDILIKEVSNAFILVKVAGSFSDNSIVALFFSKMKKRK